MATTTTTNENANGGVKEVEEEEEEGEVLDSSSGSGGKSKVAAKAKADVKENEDANAKENEDANEDVAMQDATAERENDEGDEGMEEDDDVRDSSSAGNGEDVGETARGGGTEAAEPTEAAQPMEDDQITVPAPKATDQDESPGGETEDDKPEGSVDRATDDTPDAAEETEPTRPDLSYTTRGRSTASDAESEAFERTTREALEELTRPKTKEPTPLTIGTSFLDNLSEEQRRTRTRHLPNVDGIHALRKNEVKGDLDLARNIHANKTQKRKNRSRNTDDDAMDIHDDDEITHSDTDDKQSDTIRPGPPSASKTIQIGTKQFNLPSDSFVPAAPAPTNASLLDTDASDGNASPSSKNPHTHLRSPLVVDSLVAFNPPRPPESVGAKKKHRMLRWERRPADVEVDLNNYRKTVQRTREELLNVEQERERIEAVGAHCRRHFLNHLQALNAERQTLAEELAAVQQQCVNAADLLTSRTRSRGAGKGSYFMRDVLSVVKARDTQDHHQHVPMETDTPQESPPPKPAGIGGLAAVSFIDWGHTTQIPARNVASGWLFPGDTVQTPYGEGTVLQVYNVTTVDAGDPPKQGTRSPNIPATKDKGGRNNGIPPVGLNINEGVQKTKKVGEPRSRKMKRNKGGFADPSQNKFAMFLPPRVSVRLSFGVGYFSLDAIVSKEKPSSYSKGKLAQRWKSMIEQAISVGPYVDVAGMQKPFGGADIKAEPEGTDRTGNAPMDLDTTTPRASTSGAGKEDFDTNRRVLPLGAGMLPTVTGRGSRLWDASIGELEKQLHTTLFEGCDVLGKPTNQGVPQSIKDWGEHRQEMYTLQAKVLQLRNKLYRHRRIRTLNDRMFSATKDKSARVERLVTEMRADLKSLRERLEDELSELGIDEDKAQELLASFYKEQDDDEEWEESPPKRMRISVGEAGDEKMDGEQFDQSLLSAKDRDSASGDEEANSRTGR